MYDNIDNDIQIYKSCLAEGNIRRAYVALTKYLAELKAGFPSEYKTGGISWGYLDITYFPFSNDFLRKEKLRFGIVLNHDEMQFELWLMGQNAVLQEKYWEILKDSVWNRELSEMPTYSVLAVCLCDKIDFSKKDEMTAMIFEKAMKLSAEIEEYLKATDKTDKFST